MPERSITLLCSLMALAMGLAGVIISANQYRKTQAQMAWPTTPGTVTALKSS